MKYDYRDLKLYEQIHKQRSYGDTGSVYTDSVKSFIDTTGTTSALDFGSGTGALRTSLRNKYNIDIDEFDPCYDGKRTIPNIQYDLIITTDVLEHLYEDEIENLFEEMLSLQPKFMYHAISTRKAHIHLPDGSNCHKTVKNNQWWKSRIQEITKAETIDEIQFNDHVVVLRITL